MNRQILEKLNRWQDIVDSGQDTPDECAKIARELSDPNDTLSFVMLAAMMHWEAKQARERGMVPAAKGSN